jgi:hypothetical protein
MCRLDCIHHTHPPPCFALVCLPCGPAAIAGGRVATPAQPAVRTDTAAACTDSCFPLSVVGGLPLVNPSCVCVCVCGRVVNGPPAFAHQAKPSRGSARPVVPPTTSLCAFPSCPEARASGCVAHTACLGGAQVGRQVTAREGKRAAAVLCDALPVLRLSWGVGDPSVCARDPAWIRVVVACMCKTMYAPRAATVAASRLCLGRICRVRLNGASWAVCKERHRQLLPTRH